MYAHEDIIKAADNLVCRYGTRDPFELAASSGADVKFYDLGSLKGMYTVVKRNRFILINNNLGRSMSGLICAHELAHDVLHRPLAKNKCLHDFLVYRMNNPIECEANIFAAELLIPDEDITDLIREGRTVAEIAGELGTDINLAGIKLDTLRKRGFAYNPVEFSGNFLK